MRELPTLTPTSAANDIAGIYISIEHRLENLPLRPPLDYDGLIDGEEPTLEDIADDRAFEIAMELEHVQLLLRQNVRRRFGQRAVETMEWTAEDRRRETYTIHNLTVEGWAAWLDSFWDMPNDPWDIRPTPTPTAASATLVAA